MCSDCQALTKPILDLQIQFDVVTGFEPAYFLAYLTKLSPIAPHNKLIYYLL